jgi:hypothetical protein
MNHYVAIKLKPSSGPITEPQALTQHFEATGSLMTALSGLLATDSGHTIALEFASHLQKLSIIVTGPEEWQPQLINLLYAAFPTAELEAQDHPPKLPDGELAAADVQFAPHWCAAPREPITAWPSRVKPACATNPPAGRAHYWPPPTGPT